MNVVCIYMIGTRRKLGEISPYWFVKPRYDHSSKLSCACSSSFESTDEFVPLLGRVPYLVPNALMTFLVFNGIFALLMQPYIWVVSAFVSPSWLGG